MEKDKQKLKEEISFHMGDMKKRKRKLRTPSPNIGVKG
jgi:hypothetical protein